MSVAPSRDALAEGVTSRKSREKMPDRVVIEIVWLPSCKEDQLKRFSQTWRSGNTPVETVTGEPPSMAYDAEDEVLSAMEPQTERAVPGKK
jgi:hypothetical protein